MVEIPPYGWAAEHDPILNRISDAVTQAILELAANLPTDTNLADVRAQLLAVQQSLGNAASADALELATQHLADLEEVVSTLSVAGYDDTQIKADLAEAAERLTAAEQTLADLPVLVDLTAIQAAITQLQSRIDNLDPGFVNRPPTSTAIPTQNLTVGTAFSFNASGYFSDPDNHALSALDVTGTLPPGIAQDGFDFIGNPTQVGNFTVTLMVEDIYGAQTSRSISFVVAAANGPQMLVTPAPGGIAVQNLGKFPDHSISAAIGGLTLELL
ncbi:putative Ig domain-containing protein [Paracoccus sp. 22332]|uniref:Ig domain-containing protein n=1 Tax=Paracoccus sp. 22332 TaxID=3453913 RepID=UPI003F825947